MVSLTRIYTRGGDEGAASLADGSRRPKSDLRFHAIGEIDEANSALGFALAEINQNLYTVLVNFSQLLAQCQNDLFDVGADLAVPENQGAAKPALRITQTHWQHLEQAIDKLNENLPPLDSFILPGGGMGYAAEAVARLHLARAITRRAERALVALHQAEPLNPEILRYINRLSDFLFVAARAVAQYDSSGQAEVKWQPGASLNTDQNNTKMP